MRPPESQQRALKGRTADNLQHEDANGNGNTRLRANHSQDEHDGPEQGLDHIGDKEEAGAECPPSALDDAHDIEGETHENEEHNHNRNSERSLEAVVVVVELVVVIVRIGGEDANRKAVRDDVDDHEEDPHHPEGDHDALHEGRHRVADDVMGRHGRYRGVLGALRGKFGSREQCCGHKRRGSTRTAEVLFLPWFAFRDSSLEGGSSPMKPIPK